jgi:hypothetical protein
MIDLIYINKGHVLLNPLSCNNQLNFYLDANLAFFFHSTTRLSYEKLKINILRQRVYSRF